MATQSFMLAWRIPWTEENSRPQSRYIGVCSLALSLRATCSEARNLAKLFQQLQKHLLHSCRIKSLFPACKGNCLLWTRYRYCSQALANFSRKTRTQGISEMFQSQSTWPKKPCDIYTFLPGSVSQFLSFGWALARKLPSIHEVMGNLCPYVSPSTFSENQLHPFPIVASV